MCRNPFSAYLILLLLLAGCTSVNYSEPLAGRYIRAAVAPKNFIVIGAVSARSTETHTVNGIFKRVEGAKIGYTDLVLEAAALGADDIIDVRIDVNIIKGTNRNEEVYVYTGEALAIKYVGGGYDPDEFDFLFLNR